MSAFRFYVTTLLSVLFFAQLTSQSEVAFLSVEADRSTVLAEIDGKVNKMSLPFELERNLIWIKATVDAQAGHYILDTGAPTLLINDRGEQAGKQNVGHGSGGSVALAEHRVTSFELGGVDQGAQQAYRIDLSSMEARTGRVLHGMVGYEQLDDYELFIDYPARELQLLPAKKNELHATTSPQLSVRFTYVDHLPVIVLKQGKRKLRFAIDTGAGSNLLHITDAGELPPSIQLNEFGVNVHGLDGNAANLQAGRFQQLQLVNEDVSATDFVLTDLSHLQPAEGSCIDGILGTAFLKAYRISIDYHRNKLHFW